MKTIIYGTLVAIMLLVSGCGGGAGREDTVPPVIELNGESNVTLIAGKTYHDPGATARDNIDGDITSHIIRGGDRIDSNQTGVYTITYNVTDEAGNKAKEVYRQVNVDPEENNESSAEDDEFASQSYKGLNLYYKNLSPSNYKLKQLSDATFNALTETNKLLVADKLLGTLFYSYPPRELKEKIGAGNFISTIRAGLNEERTDREWLENNISDARFVEHWLNQKEAIDIFARFYSAKELDSYFLKNWIAYALTQTIMFSPAYELDSTHRADIARVYNRLVDMLDVDSGMRYISYVHMMSEDNWRRFRSPEDNGREMLELFTLDFNDSHVPIAARALKNWGLGEGDTLVVTLNENKNPLDLFGTTIYNGDDFYREMVKSDLFTKGVTTRIVDYFFPNSSSAKKERIIDDIMRSKAEKWQDIFLQIVFSEEYLLHSSKTKSAEELLFSILKKTEYVLLNRYDFCRDFKQALGYMRQDSMRYKLGKNTNVPLDTLSFAHYHKFMRESIFMSSITYWYGELTYEPAGSWGKRFMEDSNFVLDEEDGIASLESFIQYLFNAIISRNANSEEMTFFKQHMLRNASDSNATQVLHENFNLIFSDDDDPEAQEDERVWAKGNIGTIVLDYISRLSETYTFMEVK